MKKHETVKQINYKDMILKNVILYLKDGNRFNVKVLEDYPEAIKSIDEFGLIYWFEKADIKKMEENEVAVGLDRKYQEEW